MKMNKITAVCSETNFVNGNNSLNLRLITELIEKLKIKHNVDINEIYFWPEIDRQIDFEKMDPENLQDTPYKENLVLYFGIKE